MTPAAALNPERPGGFGYLPQGIGGSGGGLVVVPTLCQVTLFGTAPDHDRTAHGSAGAGEMLAKGDGVLAQQWVVGGQVEPGRLDQKPVESDHLEAGSARLLPYLDGVRFTDLARVFFESEGCNLDAIVAALGNVGAAAFKIPSPVCLVADCKFHWVGDFLFSSRESSGWVVSEIHTFWDSLIKKNEHEFGSRIQVCQ